VLAPLARKAMTRCGALGGARMLELLTESRVAEAIFEGVPPDVPVDSDASLPCVRVEMTFEAQSEALRLEHRRAVNAGTRLRDESVAATIPVATLRRSSLRPGVILLFEVETAPPDTGPLERSLECVYVPLRHLDWARRPALVRERLAAILPGLLAALAPTLEALQRRQLQAVQARYVEARHRALDRETATRRVLHSAARHLVQVGLFDRRTKRREEAGRVDAASSVEAHEDARDRAVALASSASLRAVLLVSRR
jgi:hypothetical protein